MRIIGGSARGRRLAAPPDFSVRPGLDRQREAIFSILADRVVGSRVLDLFAGVGTFGLEALSRGARSASFVEASREVLRFLEQNAWNLGFYALSEVSEGDALVVPRLAEAAAGSWDIVFLDPPFALFSSAGGARRIESRLRELLESPALSEGAVVVLRLPAAAEHVPQIEPSDRRIYGRSQVLFFEREEFVNR